MDNLWSVFVELLGQHLRTFYSIVEFLAWRDQLYHNFIFLYILSPKLEKKLQYKLSQHLHVISSLI